MQVEEWHDSPAMRISLVSCPPELGNIRTSSLALSPQDSTALVPSPISPAQGPSYALLSGAQGADPWQKHQHRLPGNCAFSSRVCNSSQPLKGSLSRAPSPGSCSWRRWLCADTPAFPCDVGANACFLHANKSCNNLFSHIQV